MYGKARTFLTVAEFVRRMSPPEVMCDSRLNSYLREKELTLSERYVVSRPRPWATYSVRSFSFVSRRKHDLRGSR